MIVGSNNLPEFENFPMRDDIEQKLGTPIFLENDANAAALGEKWMGAGRDVQDLVLLTLGTGIGGGIISDGKRASWTRWHGRRARAHDGCSRRQPMRLRKLWLPGKARLRDSDRRHGAHDAAWATISLRKMSTSSPRAGTRRPR